MNTSVKYLFILHHSSITTIITYRIALANTLILLDRSLLADEKAIKAFSDGPILEVDSKF